jgi:hypothetical protein
MMEATAELAGAHSFDWRSRIAHMSDIFVEPSAVFDQEAEQPNALFPIVVLVIGLTVLLMAYSGVMINIALSAVPEAMRAEVTPSVKAMIEHNRLFGILLSPVYVIVPILATGVVLYGFGTMGASRHYEGGGLHRAVSIAAYAAFANLLEQVTTYLMLRATRWERLQYFWELKPLPGLHYFVTEPNTHRVAFAVLERVNPFMALYGFLLGYGVRRVFGTSRMVAVLAALTCVLGELAVVAFMAYVKS